MAKPFRDLSNEEMKNWSEEDWMIYIKASTRFELDIEEEDDDIPEPDRPVDFGDGNGYDYEDFGDDR